MFRGKYLYIITAFLLLFAGGILKTEAQESDTANLELKKRALERFQSEEFNLALSDFQVLMDEYPRDPMFKYYCGVCMVEENLDYEEAVEMLHFSSSRGAPEDVYYFLGEAYRRMYDFNKAKQYFLQFDKEAPRAMAKERNSKLLIRSVQTASRITLEYNPFEVINVTTMNLYDPEQYGQVRMKGGLMQQKPEELFTEGEERGDLNSIMFLPEKVGRGEYIYFAGYERGKKGGSQIFMAKKGNTGNWVDIKAIDELNTDLDEIMPYFDPVSKDIYFASNGFEGIGGFDLYRSHLDEERMKWSEPVNLGFPINSAFDDYLLLPGRDLGMVMFFTARTGTDSSSTVYRVHFSEPKVSLASEPPKEIRRIANLGSRAVEKLAEIESVPSVVKTPVVKPESKEVATIKVQPKTKWKIAGVESEYQAMVASALRHQTVSDSLTELSTKARIKVRESDDPNDRWLYQKQIMVWEKKAASEQEKADGLYTQINSYVPSKSTETQEAIEKDTVISDITVYRFKDTAEEIKPLQKENPSVKKEIATVQRKVIAPEPEKGKAPEQRKVKASVQEKAKAPLPKEKKEEIQPTNRFVILDASPYSADHPIPIDPQLPTGSFYRIQVGAFSQAVAPDAFGGLSPITAEYIPDRNLTKYYAGKFSKYKDASKALTEVRSAGYEQAFIVSWYNGSKMTTDKVMKLEK